MVLRVLRAGLGDVPRLDRTFSSNDSALSKNQVQCGNDAVRIGRPRAVVELLVIQVGWINRKTPENKAANYTFLDF